MKLLLAGVAADHLLTPFFVHSALTVYLHHLHLSCHSFDHSLLGWKLKCLIIFVLVDDGAVVEFLLFIAAVVEITGFLQVDLLGVHVKV